MRVYVDGIGLCGPGLAGWGASLPILAGAAPYISAAAVVPAVDLLPPAERRRMVATVKLGLAVALEAIAASGEDMTQIATVFAASGADGDTLASILGALAAPEREVSPTRFQNSVHNAPSGYWTIAARSHAPSTTVCAYDSSFGAGLLEATAQVVVEQRTVVLIVADIPYPEPLHAVRPVHSTFGLALVLSPHPGARTLAMLELACVPDHHPLSTMTNPALEGLRLGNPAARALPLLTALAAGVRRDVTIEHVAGGRLAVSVRSAASHESVG